MEAMRILKALEIRPRRTIRIDPSQKSGPPFTSSGEAHTSMASPPHGHQTLPRARRDVGLDGVSHA